MSVSSERELAHARDVTITECQERLREMSKLVASGELNPGLEALIEAFPHISQAMARHWNDAAAGLETLRIGSGISAETQTRLKEAAELAYRITTTAGDRRHADAWASLKKDLWNVLRLYELQGPTSSE